MSESSVPRLDLAPKLSRPLSLWNPLDYLRLVWWCLFFPQAIGWYVQCFGQAQYLKVRGRSGVIAALRDDPVQRRLVTQALVGLPIIVVALGLLCEVLGIPWNWVGVVVGVVAGVVVGVAAGVVVGVAVGVVAGVAFGAAFGVALAVGLGVLYGVAGGAAGVVALSVTFGVAIGMTIGVVFGFDVGMALGAAFVVALGVSGGVAIGMVFTVVFGVAGGVVLGVVDGIVGGVAVGVFGGVVVGATAAVFAARVPDWIVSIPLVRWRPNWGMRMAWLPLPGVQQRLERWLEQDWPAGVDNVNQVLAYSMQFVPAVGAVKNALEKAAGERLLERCATLCEDVFDWRLVRFVSADLRNALVAQAIDGLVVVPGHWRRRWQARFPVYLRIYSPAQAACAGFWLWHEQQTEAAAMAFDYVRHVRHGPEVFSIATAIVSAQQVADLTGLPNWHGSTAWLDEPSESELRPGTLHALRQLRAVAHDARVASVSAAIANRSLALNRAGAHLTELLQIGASFCPHPEWPLVEQIAKAWRDVISKAGGLVAEEVLRQPAVNPYDGYSGLPVSGSIFVGRSKIFEQISTRWAVAERLPSLVLYGHRRMGKTSILRNLDQLADRRIILIYLDMQNASWVDHTGQLLLDLAEALHDGVSKAGLDAGPAPFPTGYDSLGTARRSLNALLAKLDPQMTGQRLILAIDEFEIIEQGIVDGRIDPGFLRYLRSISQDYNWLALIFAGLHTLEEMGHDYQSAFYGLAEHIRVGYMGRDDAIRLITQPHPDFTLEYEPDLREEIYRLTYGQPYLLQRLCWELVNRWNERFITERETLPRVLTMDDLAPVLTADFFNGAGYYFDGVWTNITEAERELLRVLAGRDEGVWTITELVAATGQSEQEVDDTVRLLRRHDVIVDEVGGVRFAAELMRRWVAEYQAT